jgi:tetratricopeptide (TPR) repeat protein
MGIHDLERLGDDHKGGGKRRPWLVPVVVLLLAGAIFAVYLLADSNDGGNADGDLDAGDLAAALQALGIPQQEIAVPFEITPALRSYAEQAVDGADDEEAVQALLDALAKLRKDGKWAPHPQRESRPEDPLTADQLLAKLDQTGDTPWKATSYELACLLLALARAAEVDAYMAQIHSFDGEQKPADPGGRMGRYGVVVGQGSDKERPPLFDPYGLRSAKAAQGEFDVLTDLQAVAPGYSHRSLAALIRLETSVAFKLNDLAIKIDPDCALYRGGRGYIFIASEAPAEALAELEKAVKRRDDAITRVNLAEVLLFVDPTGKRAEAELQAALDTMPDYPRAHLLQAMVHVMRREFDGAEQEIAKAERLDPGSPTVAMAWAQYYAGRNMAEEALAKVDQALRVAGDSPTVMLEAAAVYRATARFDEMRAMLKKALARFDSPVMVERLKRAFGYDPDDEEEDDLGETDTAELAVGGLGDAGLGGLELQLGAEQGPAGPRLGGGLGGGGLGGGGLGGGGLGGGGLGGGGLGGGGLGGGGLGGGGLQGGDLQLKVKPPGE